MEAGSVSAVSGVGLAVAKIVGDGVAPGLGDDVGTTDCARLGGASVTLVSPAHAPSTMIQIAVIASFTRGD